MCVCVCMKLDFLGVSSPRERRNRFGLNDSWEIYRTFFSRSFDIDGGYGWMDGWRKGWQWDTGRAVFLNPFSDDSKISILWYFGNFVRARTIFHPCDWTLLVSRILIGLVATKNIYTWSVYVGAWNNVERKCRVERMGSIFEYIIGNIFFYEM